MLDHLQFPVMFPLYLDPRECEASSIILKLNLFAISPNHAIKVFQQKYPDATDIYVIQDLFKGNK